MAKKKKSKPIVYPVVFMVILTIFFGGALAGINALTKDTIAQQEALKIKQNVLYVLGLDDNATFDPESIEALYSAHVTERQIRDLTIYVGQKDGAITGYAFPIVGPGLWGSMTGYAAINAERTEILGMSVVSHSETPGLGGRIDEIWFKEQFRKIPIIAASNSDEIIVFKPKPGGNVDAISGATLTSEAVRVMLNEDIYNFIANYGGDL